MKNEKSINDLGDKVEKELSQNLVDAQVLMCDVELATAHCRDAINRMEEMQARLRKQISKIQERWGHNISPALQCLLDKQQKRQ